MPLLLLTEIYPVLTVDTFVHLWNSSIITSHRSLRPTVSHFDFSNKLDLYWKYYWRLFIHIINSISLLLSSIHSAMYLAWILLFFLCLPQAPQWKGSLGLVVALKYHQYRYGTPGHIENNKAKYGHANRKRERGVRRVNQSETALWW